MSYTTKRGGLRLSGALLAAAAMDSLSHLRGGVRGHDLQVTEALAGLRTDVLNVQADLKAALDRQDTEIRKNGKASEETGKRVDDLTAQLSRIGQDIEAVQVQMRTLENETARSHLFGGRTSARSVGALFAESNEFATRTGSRSEVFNVGGSFFNLDSGAGSGEALLVPQRRAEIITPPQRQMRLRDVLNVAPTEAPSIEFMQELLFTNNAAPVAEKANRPQSNITYERKSVQVRAIGHWVPATREILDDVSQLRSNIDGRLMYGVKLREEAQCLYGNGTSPNLQGMLTHPNVQTYAWSAGQAGDTKMDAIRRAITKGQKAEYPMDYVVLSPTEWEEIELLKGSDGQYIWVQVTIGGELRLWRANVVVTTAIADGDGLVGASMASTLWDREQSTIRITDSHADYFISGQLAILAEERVALEITRPQAQVAIDFDAAPAP